MRTYRTSLISLTLLVGLAVTMLHAAQSAIFWSSNKKHPSGNRTYSTNFPLTENPISEGGNWINGGTNGLQWQNCRTTTNKVFGTQSGTNGFDDSTCLVSGTWGSNQMAQATVFRTASGAQFDEVEIRLRSNISANSNSGYEFNCSVVPTDPYVQIVRWNGPLGNFTLLDSRDTAGCANGSTLKATAVGSTLTVFVGGVEVFHVTDSTFFSGKPGMGFYIQNGTSADNAGFGFINFTAQDGL